MSMFTPNDTITRPVTLPDGTILELTLRKRLSKGEEDAVMDAARLRFEGKALDGLPGDAEMNFSAMFTEKCVQYVTNWSNTERPIVGLDNAGKRAVFKAMLPEFFNAISQVVTAYDNEVAKAAKKALPVTTTGPASSSVTSDATAS